MAEPMSTWTYADAWRRAAEVLGVQIEGRTRVEFSPGLFLEAEMLVRGYGAPRGTLVFRHTDQYPAFFDALHRQGLTASSWRPYRAGVEARLTELVDILGDWGWCGEGPDPAWLLTVDAQNWAFPADFYGAVLPMLRAPEWHGHNLDALWDSISTNDINGLGAPFVLRILNTEHFSPEMAAFMEKVEAIFRDAAEADVPVALHVWP